ncbi:acylphosphatase [Hansschlegelia plantiphila]|uniref:acylphosphatase n=1 Tax=Hansschlegelia plantiphila TaxID=374655 RepID=A0A9W6IYV7_9HYPH|nr:acylphosphatase [Hansschlegelia plantiphila]GLK67562.1 acylphosphatase [Hansschlegelia plantiphila]
MGQSVERFEITGLVQGVFYRKWARATAEGLGLRGFVRNRADGSVEAVLAGPEERLDGFAEACRAGPPDARVEQIRRLPAKAGDMPEGQGVTIAEDA